jgi:hypothetical protein
VADGSTRIAANAIPVFVADPDTGFVVKPQADGSILISGFSGNITGNVTVGTGVATAADPTYVEGTSNPLSMDLKGNLRTVTIAGFDSNAIYAGNVPETPKFAKITASATGATQVVAAVAARKIRVLGYVVTGAGTVNVKFQSHTAGDITGLLYMNATEFGTAPFNPLGWFETVAGEALDINLSGNQSVGGHLAYAEIP